MPYPAGWPGKKLKSAKNFDITPYLLIYPMKTVASRGQPNPEIRHDEKKALNRSIGSIYLAKSNLLFSERVRALDLGGNSSEEFRHSSNRFPR